MIAKNPLATSVANPSNLPPRYEIRQLTEEHASWANAIVIHSNVFHSPVWSLLYPDHKAARVFTARTATKYACDHQISSGMSFGVFDTEYKYKRPESAATGEALYWDELEDDPDATSEAFLERMDFPLASIALAYDEINELDIEKLAPTFELVPLSLVMYQLLETQDARQGSWKPQAAREVLLRNATSTRHDYEGKHLMGSLARFLMREAKLMGYKGIQIECAHNAVTHVWCNPPAPFKGELITQIDMGTFEKEGKVVFAPSKQVCTKIHCTL